MARMFDRHDYFGRSERASGWIRPSRAIGALTVRRPDGVVQTARTEGHWLRKRQREGVRWSNGDCFEEVVRSRVQ